MDPVVRWSVLALIFLPAAVLVARVNPRLITHHARVWALKPSWRALERRSALLWNDGHVALGGRVLSSRIWQARFGGLLSMFAAMTFMAATNPRCVALWL